MAKQSLGIKAIFEGLRGAYNGDFGFRIAAQFFGLLILVQVILVVFTRFERTITIKTKMPYSLGGGRFLSVSNVIMDENGDAYTVTNQFLLLHFTSAEVWSNLQDGKQYRVKGYGIRVPILGWFPNIIEAQAL